MATHSDLFNSPRLLLRPKRCWPDGDLRPSRPNCVHATRRNGAAEGVGRDHLSQCRGGTLQAVRNGDDLRSHRSRALCRRRPLQSKWWCWGCRKVAVTCKFLTLTTLVFVQAVLQLRLNRILVHADVCVAGVALVLADTCATPKRRRRRRVSRHGWAWASRARDGRSRAGRPLLLRAHRCLLCTVSTHNCWPSPRRRW